MLFSSFTFLLAFLPVCLLCYFTVGKIFPKTQNIIIVLFGLVFYAWGEPVYVFLMIGSIVFNYFFGRAMGHFVAKDDAEKGQGKAGKKVSLIACLLFNLAILGFFKYADFLVSIINELTGASIGKLDLPLPIGISFYTFMAMSYVIDIFKKKCDADKNFIRVAAYITLFPHLVAGPIVRFETIQNELRDKDISFDNFIIGLKRFVVGLAKKVLIANNMAVIADVIYGTPLKELYIPLLWLAAIAYTLQIYFDFSGYSDMAIGLARMFGFHFLENFNYPYISRSITDFWRRWHISMSTWFRDYIFVIPIPWIFARTGTVST
jgi:alginate O-acetyltransferase complex protein AlgI